MPPRTERASVSVVLATHARSKFLSDCVTSIVGAMGPADELMVMECCNDDAAPLLDEVIAPVMHVPGDHAAKAPKLNLAVRAARGEVVLITDDDCRVAPGWVDAMTRPFANPAVGVVFGPVRGLSEIPASPETAAVPAGPAPPELWNYAHGASMAVRRSAVADAGGFDERLGAGTPHHGGEEADLVLRLRDRGWLCEVADAPTVKHLEWRDEEETVENLLGYQHGSGAYLGAGLRRRPLEALKPLALRLLHERGLWRQRKERGPWFGPRMTIALAGGLIAGVMIPPRRFLDEPPAPRERNGRPRVLWVTDESPDRTRGGGSIRQAMLLEQLRGRADTTLLLVGHLRDEATRQSVQEVIELPRPRARKDRGPVGRRFHALSHALTARRSADVRRAEPVRRVLAPVLERIADDYDVVVVHHLHLASLVPAARDERKARWILHLFDVPSERARQEAAVEHGARQRWLLHRDLAKTTRVERAARAAYDGAVVVSDNDAAALGTIQGDATITVVPNGVDVNAILPSPLPDEPNVLLPATLNYRPNVLGAIWFCDEVLPLVQQQVPEVRFHLVGRRPVPDVVALADRPGVELHADVERMEPWLRWARVVVVPLHVGTGTRVKALEAMAAGRPVVGTTIGLEGLGLVDGTHAGIADDPDAMAIALVEVLTSERVAGRLAAAGRRHVTAHFQWADSGTLLGDALGLGRLPAGAEPLLDLAQHESRELGEWSEVR